MEHPRQSKTLEPKRDKGLQRKESEKSYMSKSTYSGDIYASYSNCNPSRQDRDRQEQDRPRERNQSEVLYKEWNSYSENSREVSSMGNASYSSFTYTQKQSINPKRMETKRRFKGGNSEKIGIHTGNYWEENTPESPLCYVDDGIPQRVARLKALGNAIVPQCSEWIGEQIWKSGILQGGEHV
jgi:site-specific DNA-cytosine methylase